MNSYDYYEACISWISMLIEESGMDKNDSQVLIMVGMHHSSDSGNSCETTRPLNPSNQWNIHKLWTVWSVELLLFYPFCSWCYWWHPAILLVGARKRFGQIWRSRGLCERAIHASSARSERQGEGNSWKNMMSTRHYWLLCWVLLNGW